MSENGGQRRGCCFHSHHFSVLPLASQSSQRPANAEPTEEQTMATIILMRGWDRIQAELIDDNHARDSKGQLWTRQEGHYPERWVIERADGKFDAVASRVK